MIKSGCERKNWLDPAYTQLLGYRAAVDNEGYVRERLGLQDPDISFSKGFATNTGAAKCEIATPVNPRAVCVMPVSVSQDRSPLL